MLTARNSNHDSGLSLMISIIFITLSFDFCFIIGLIISIKFPLNKFFIAAMSPKFLFLSLEDIYEIKNIKTLNNFFKYIKFI